MKFRHIITRWWPSVIVILVILYATLYPDPAGVDKLPPIPYLDKLIHAIMFGGMAGALAFDHTRAVPGRRRPGHRVMLLCCLASIVAGGVIELLQEAMGLGRGAEWLDFGADALGVLVAYFAAPPAIAAVLRKKTVIP